MAGGRFGAVSPAQTYATKVRWLVGCLVSIIIVLAAAFIIVAQNSPKDNGVAVATEQQAAPPPIGKAEIMVAQSRIEVGTQLKEPMFTYVQMDEAQVPMGALRKQNLPQVLEKFSARLINPNVPILTEDIADKRGFSALNIPAGYRAVTIVVDRRAGVEGFARPDSRVDVLWTYVKDGRQQVATIVRFVKILSVAGMTAHSAEGGGAPDNQGQTTVTLLATERDAKKIELARNLGTVSLSLVGEVEQSNPVGGEPDSVTMNDLLNIQEQTPDGKVAEPQADGILYSTDPKTGKQVRYILQNGTRRWIQDKNF